MWWRLVIEHLRKNSDNYYSQELAFRWVIMDNLQIDCVSS